METCCQSFELFASPQVPIRITTDVPSGLVRTILLGAASSHLVLALVQDIGFEPMTYALEERCCCPAELILHMLDGCFAVSKHYHRLLGGLFLKGVDRLNSGPNN